MKRSSGQLFTELFGLFILLFIFGLLMVGMNMLSKYVISPFFRTHLEIVDFISWSMQTGWVFPVMTLGFVFVLMAIVFTIVALASSAGEKRAKRNISGNWTAFVSLLKDPISVTPENEAKYASMTSWFRSNFTPFKDKMRAFLIGRSKSEQDTEDLLVLLEALFSEARSLKELAAKRRAGRNKFPFNFEDQNLVTEFFRTLSSVVL